jgi:cytochrome P450
MAITDDGGSGEFDPRLDAVMQCPYPHYERLRREDPVHRMPGELVGRPGETVFAVTRHDLATQVLLDWRTYSSRFGSPGAAPPEHLRPQLLEIAAQGYRRPPTMLTADPPMHTRYRRLVAKAFSPRRVSQLEPAIGEICDDLVDQLATVPPGATVDLLPAFCVPIPTRTIAHALGVPQERYADFKRWADASVAAIGTQLDDEGWLAAARGVVELQQYFAAELEQRRVEPRDDLLTDLLRARLAPEELAEAGDDVTVDDAGPVDGSPLTVEEMLSVVQQLQVAGSETTASLIADAVLLLAGHPDAWDRLAEDRRFANVVVEECLRLASPNLGLFRIVTTDTELEGVPIPAGSTMWVLFGAANRDEAVFAEPDAFDPAREHLGAHLAFGKGIHYCIGAPLARLEAQVALAALSRRFAAVTPVDPGSLRYRSSCILRGLDALPVTLTARV